MALTSLDKAKVFQLLGIPQGGAGMIVTSLSHIPPTLAAIWTTTQTEADFTQLVTKVDTYLTNASADIVTLIQELLTKYDAARGSVMHVTKSGDSEGELVNHPRQVELCRQEIAKLVGVWCPRGGFIAESDRLYGRGIGGGDR